MPRKMKGNPAQNRRSQPYQASASNSSAVSVINADPSTRRTLRWAGSVTSTASLIVTRACLLSAIVANPGTAAVAALVLVPIYESVRIRRARIFMPPPAAGTITQEVSLEWSSYLGKDVKMSISAMSSLGGVVSSRPPAGTRAAMWGSANTSGSATTSINEVLFTVNHDATFANPATTVSFVIELDLDFVQANDTDSVINVTTAAAATTLPGLYQAPLDFITPGGIMGARRFDPLGVQDVRLDSAGAAIAFTAVVRTN